MFVGTGWEVEVFSAYNLNFLFNLEGKFMGVIALLNTDIGL